MKRGEQLSAWGCRGCGCEGAGAAGVRVGGEHTNGLARLQLATVVLCSVDFDQAACKVGGLQGGGGFGHSF